MVALSSVNEGTPVSLIEAMTAGTPVASTAAGGVPDVLRGGERGGWPYPGSTALAGAIERALTPQSRERAARFRKQVEREFGADRLCRELADLYVSLLRLDPVPQTAH